MTVAKFYTLEELLPVINESARSYCESVADTYVAGIEFNNELFPMMTIKDAGEADAYCAELDRSLEFHFKPIFDDEETQMLAGFTFVPNRGMSNISIGKRNRLYLHGDIKTQLGIDAKKAKVRVLVAYNPTERAFAIVKPTSKAVTDDMRAAGYFVSKRNEITCAKLFKEFKLDKFEGQTFYADTASLSGNVVIFKQ